MLHRIIRGFTEGDNRRATGRAAHAAVERDGRNLRLPSLCADVDGLRAVSAALVVMLDTHDADGCDGGRSLTFAVAMR